MISAPEDYGLSPEQTLTHRLPAAAPDGFEAFWAAWRAEFDETRTRLAGSVEVGENPVRFTSFGEVSIHGRLTLPEPEPRGFVVTSHGYGAVPDVIGGDDEPWTESGLGTLRIRVRGYPPSTAEIGDRRAGPGVGRDGRGVDRAVAVRFTSFGEVSIHGRLTLPEPEPRGFVVTSHGYGAVPDVIGGDDEPWTESGLGTLRIRVRGYPPSTAEIGDRRAGWIMHNLGDPNAWILRGAVADVALACRVVAERFGCPVALHGESLGGGLAVMAAAQLERTTHAPHRLVIGLPTFGDWAWRRGRYCNGSGRSVNDLLDALREDSEPVFESIRLFDAALHARDVTVPVLAKLAERDDVVPAPSAAAVINGLPGSCRRFVTEFGHFDGGIADMRRHVWFERLHPSFADPGLEPAAWESRVPEAARVFLR